MMPTTLPTLHAAEARNCAITHYGGAIEITIANAGHDHFNANINLRDTTRFPARIRAIATELRNQGFVGRFLITHHDGEVAIARKSELAQFSAP
jgi:hypothetical protein